VFEKMKFMKHK